MIDISAKVDTRGFEKAFKEYMKVTSKNLTEATNYAGYDIARFAAANTPGAETDTIDKSLRAPSRINSRIPVVALLVNRERKGKGNSLLAWNSRGMVKEINLFISRRKGRRKFLASGWLPAVKTFARMLGKAYRGRIKGKDKGGAKVAKTTLNNWNPVATIWNSVYGGKHPSPEVTSKIQEGLQKGLNDKIRDYRKYIVRKQEEAVRRFWS